MSEPITLHVHPGIGDISWVLSKLATTGEMFDLVIALDKKTSRSLPLAGLVPFINSVRQGTMEDYYVLSQVGNAKWSDYMDAREKGQELYITANPWLEKGNRLEGYLPDLDTDFHYPIRGTVDEVAWAESKLVPCAKHFAIYVSAKGGIDAWSGWYEYEWAEFIRFVHNTFPGTAFYLIGAGWDRDMQAAVNRILDIEGVEYVDTVGKTSLGKAVELIRRMDYFAGFASGMTILADVMKKPVLMLYPDYLADLMYSWPCPVSMATGSYIGMAWRRPIEVFTAVRDKLETYLG